ncbi:MAG: hypothetical protein SCH66_08375 [Methanolobus sp.]|nr:hypothetical protein [Methanolobus sp.]
MPISKFFNSIGPDTIRTPDTSEQDAGPENAKMHASPEISIIETE